MTTDTIKEVLSKIMSINRNLTSESLHNLLVASSWDKQDIEEGVRIFEYYSGKTSSPNINNSKDYNVDNKGSIVDKITDLHIEDIVPLEGNNKVDMEAIKNIHFHKPEPKQETSKIIDNPNSSFIAPDISYAKKREDNFEFIDPKKIYGESNINLDEKKSSVSDINKTDNTFYKQNNIKEANSIDIPSNDETIKNVVALEEKENADSSQVLDNNGFDLSSKNKEGSVVGDVKNVKESEKEVEAEKETSIYDGIEFAGKTEEDKKDEEKIEITEEDKAVLEEVINLQETNNLSVIEKELKEAEENKKALERSEASENIISVLDNHDIVESGSTTETDSDNGIFSSFIKLLNFVLLIILVLFVFYIILI